MTMRAHPDAELMSTEVETISNSLLSLKEEIDAQNSVHLANAMKKYDCSLTDFADAASQSEQSYKSLILLNNNKEKLRLVERAIAKLKKGTYGVSELTGMPIPFERLKLVPWATTCIND
ncbi:TraR/DksA family transcriptional regulator [Vibrio ishigakensis]|uniref:TraR/DksA family transcriptional regulator n=1 Tax=Vibrio ishigakensis TaxID=1481914 RepID=UPI0021C423DF|nr:hypothetical protein [Vibrio ishigakensis]